MDELLQSNNNQRVGFAYHVSDPERVQNGDHDLNAVSIGKTSIY
jgi:hypothetical protein